MNALSNHQTPQYFFLNRGPDSDGGRQVCVVRKKTWTEFFTDLVFQRTQPFVAVANYKILDDYKKCHIVDVQVPQVDYFSKDHDTWIKMILPNIEAEAIAAGAKEISTTVDGRKVNAFGELGYFSERINDQVGYYVYRKL